MRAIRVLSLALAAEAGQDGRTADNGGVGGDMKFFSRLLGGAPAEPAPAANPQASAPRAEPPQAQIDQANAASTRSTELYGEQRYAEALPFAERAAVMFAQMLGADHPHVAQMRVNQAAVLWKLGRLAEAEPLYRLALAAREKSLGRGPCRDRGTALQHRQLLSGTAAVCRGRRPFRARAGHSREDPRPGACRMCGSAGRARANEYRSRTLSGRRTAASARIADRRGRVRPRSSSMSPRR